MGWDIDVREKIYLRLANEIFFRILHGEYAQGEKLPSYAELAKKAGCSPETWSPFGGRARSILF